MKHIDVISIPVSDPERARKFYAHLGFEVMAETPMEQGQLWLQMGLPGATTSITLVTWFKKMPAGSLQGLVIRTDTLDQDIQELQVKGIQTGKVEETPWGKFVSLKDPDGNGLSFHQRAL